MALWVLTGAGAWADVYINEVDSNQTAADSGEFVELYDGGAGETSLDGLLLVFFNGESDTSYRVVDLTGESTDASGYFVVGNAGVTPRPGIILPDNTIQNGADAVALYDASEFSLTPGVPAPVTTQGLISAVVYGNSSADDSGLLVLLDPGQPQLDEHESGSSNEHSLQRCASNASGPLQTAGFGAALPTPWAENNCPQDPAAVVINELDSNQAGADGREFVELYDGGAGKTPLDGLVLVFFNGAVNTTYFSLDLDGTATDAQGYFLAGSFDVGPDIVLADGTIQNGADAVALYAGDAADFPDGGPARCDCVYGGQRGGYAAVGAGGGHWPDLGRGRRGRCRPAFLAAVPEWRRGAVESGAIWDFGSHAARAEYLRERSAGGEVRINPVADLCGVSSGVQ